MSPAPSASARRSEREVKPREGTRGQGDTWTRIATSRPPGRLFVSCARRGRGTIHHALPCGGRGVATPLPSASLRRPRLSEAAQPYPMQTRVARGAAPTSRRRCRDAVPTRYIASFYARHSLDTFFTFAQAAGRFALLHLGQHVVLSLPLRLDTPTSIL